MATEKQNKRPIPPVDHSGHRKRLKKRAELEGLEHFEPHNLLELLLFYTIPRADTNDTGHRLLDEFGSFAGVLDASPQALMRVHGVGRETALFLSMLPAVFRMYVQSQTNDYRGLKNLDEAVDILFPKFTGVDHELLYMLCLDSGNRVKRCVLLAEGNQLKVELDVRRILTEVIISNASSVILAHNHPSGDLKPSVGDHRATKIVADALQTIDVPLVEHFVFAQNRFMPLSTDSRFSSSFGTAFRSTYRTDPSADSWVGEIESKKMTYKKQKGK
ncbi:MAG: RadC family protein [Clostridia bacterium]|nr:RadC family protein [Clostridia bacterium]